MKKLVFIDQATIKIKAGKGGDGKMGFHKEKYVEHGGPSGGNGGNGGSIFLIATNNENTLLKFKGKSIYKGNNGVSGGLKNMTGAKGEDIYISVPIGTEILIDNKKIIDLQYNGQIWLASKGGRGGRGNKSFKSSKNTTPTLFEYGEDVEWKELTLNLKVLADVGLLGYPNAGKSTFLSSITNAKPKISNYEFTTLSPNLGVVNSKLKSFVITDLPGLIEGASNNKGMGITFLKHLSRTKLLVHLIDSSQNNLFDKYKKLRNELKNFSNNLNKKLEIIVFSKIDLINNQVKEIIKKEFKNKEIYFISSFTKEGLDDLVKKISKKIIDLQVKENNDFNNLLKDKSDHNLYELKEEEDPLIIDIQDNIVTISNRFTKFWANRIPMASLENTWRLISKFKSKGIIDKCKSAGMKNGDLLVVKGTPFTLEYKED